MNIVDSSMGSPSKVRFLPITCNPKFPGRGYLDVSSKEIVPVNVAFNPPLIQSEGSRTRPASSVTSSAPNTMSFSILRSKFSVS